MIGNPSSVVKEGYRVLMRELGAADTVIFLRQFEKGTGNYTEERQTLLDSENNSVESIIERIEKRKTRTVQAAFGDNTQ